MTRPESNQRVPNPASPDAMQTFKTVFLPWLPAVYGITAIFYVSGLPGNEIHLPEFHFSDKVFHSLAYGLLGGLINWRLGIRRYFRPLSASDSPSAAIPSDLIRFDWRGVLIGIAYGASDELHQYFVPSRECDVFDWMADSVGVICGVLIMSWLTRVWIRRGGSRTEKRLPQI